MQRSYPCPSPPWKRKHPTERLWLQGGHIPLPTINEGCSEVGATSLEEQRSQGEASEHVKMAVCHGRGSHPQSSLGGMQQSLRGGVPQHRTPPPRGLSCCPRLAQFFPLPRLTFSIRAGAIVLLMCSTAFNTPGGEATSIKGGGSAGQTAPPGAWRRGPGLLGAGVGGMPHTKRRAKSSCQGERAEDAR